jgi:hypothetical protein
VSTLNEQVRAELMDLAREHSLLTPEIVLERAKQPESALHSHFTWDDAEAAALRRLDEARSLIMRVRVRIQGRANEAPIQVRAFVSLDDDRVAGGGYRPIVSVLGDDVLRAQLLRTAIAELQALQKRYGHLQELAQVFAEADAVANEKRLSQAG